MRLRFVRDLFAIHEMRFLYVAMRSKMRSHYYCNTYAMWLHCDHAAFVMRLRCSCRATLAMRLHSVCDIVVERSRYTFALRSLVLFHNTLNTPIVVVYIINLLTPLQTNQTSEYDELDKDKHVGKRLAARQLVIGDGATNRTVGRYLFVILNYNGHLAALLLFTLLNNPCCSLLFPVTLCHPLLSIALCFSLLLSTAL
jgi:hypothetical protein